MSHVLHLGDCLEGMAGLADKSVDSIVTDPPYSAKLHAGHERKRKLLNGYPVPAITFDSVSPEQVATIAKELARISRGWILTFCDEIVFGAWVVELQAAGAEYVRKGMWIKTDPQPQTTGDRPADGSELIVVSHAARASGRMAWNGGGKPATYIGHRIDAERLHPTQKPDWLMRDILRDFTDPGELVCDPFAGSGTTGVACKRLGRNFIGWEKDPKFHAAAVKRIEAAREQFRLPRLPKAKQTGMVLHAPNSAVAGDAQTILQGDEH